MKTNFVEGRVHLLRHRLVRILELVMAIENGGRIVLLAQKSGTARDELPSCDGIHCWLCCDERK